MRKTLVVLAIVALITVPVLPAAIAAITGADIVDGSIVAADLASNSIGSRAIADGSVTNADLAAALRSSLVYGTVPSGRTIHGAVGADYDVSGSDSCPCDWGIDVSLPVAAANALSDDDVFINVAGWVSGDTGQVQPTTTDTNVGCTGSPASPTAPAGKVCIYVAGGDNATGVQGYSVLPGTGASPYGFKLKWVSAGTPQDTFIDAVWAYTAP